MSLGLVARLAQCAANVDSPEAFLRTYLSAKRKADVVLLRNGDKLEGVLSAFEPDRIEVEVDKRITAVKRSQVSLVALNTELAEKPKTKGLQARLTVASTGSANGARLTLGRHLARMAKRSMARHRGDAKSQCQSIRSARSIGCRREWSH